MVRTNKLGYFVIESSSVPEALPLKATIEYLYRCIDIYKVIKDKQKVDPDDYAAVASLLGILVSRVQNRTGGSILVDPRELPFIRQIDATVARLEKSITLLKELRTSIDPAPESLRIVADFLGVLRSTIDEATSANT